MIYLESFSYMFDKNGTFTRALPAFLTSALSADKPSTVPTGFSPFAIATPAEKLRLVVDVAVKIDKVVNIPMP